MSNIENPEVMPTMLADSLIAAEIGRQDRMWGPENDRADISKGQLFAASRAQQSLVWGKEEAGMSSELAVRVFGAAYPKDWSGFRDYGSNVVNLVVAAAYLRQEIVRRIRNGESTFRASRDQATQPYHPASGLPNVIEP